MKQIGTVLAKSDSRGSLPSYGSKSETRSFLIGDRLPRICNRSTDVDIPRSAWSSWREHGKPQTLRRPLTAAERGELEARVNELAPALTPFGHREAPHVALALTDMFSGFTSMRQSGDEAGARVESVIRLLTPYPAWAIQKACISIRTNGVWRDDKFDRRWPPNDPEIVEMVRKETEYYESIERSSIALLLAKVEER